MVMFVGVRVHGTAHGHGQVRCASSVHVQVPTQPHAVDVLTISQSDTLQLKVNKEERGSVKQPMNCGAWYAMYSHMC